MLAEACLSEPAVTRQYTQDVSCFSSEASRHSTDRGEVSAQWGKDILLLLCLEVFKQTECQEAVREHKTQRRVCFLGCDEILEQVFGVMKQNVGVTLFPRKTLPGYRQCSSIWPYNLG